MTSINIFCSYYDAYRGVIAYFRVIEGTIKKGDRIVFMASKKVNQSVALYLSLLQLSSKKLDSVYLNIVQLGHQFSTLFMELCTFKAASPKLRIYFFLLSEFSSLVSH